LPGVEIFLNLVLPVVRDAFTGPVKIKRHTGPGVWMINFAGRLNPGVMTASPVSTGASLPHAS
jgi:hypothetical protein